MTDEEFKRHLYKKLAEDKKNEGVLTNRLYPQKESKNNNNTYPKSKKQ